MFSTQFLQYLELYRIDLNLEVVGNSFRIKSLKLLQFSLESVVSYAHSVESLFTFYIYCSLVFIV